jgi:hypothetical protein
MLGRNWKIISLVVIALVASTATLLPYRRITVLEDRLGCVATWLERAKTMHGAQMKERGNFSEEGMRKLMESVDSAYWCATKEPTSAHAPGAGSFGQHGDMPPHK